MRNTHTAWLAPLVLALCLAGCGGDGSAGGTESADVPEFGTVASPCSSGRFVRRGSQVLDTTTKLAWDAHSEPTPTTLVAARSLCAGRGARLPTPAELQAVLTTASGCGFDECAFGATRCGTFFADPRGLDQMVVGTLPDAYVVNAITRTVVPLEGDRKLDVRCVTGPASR